MVKDYLSQLQKSVNGCSAIIVYDTMKDSNATYRVGTLSDIEINAIKQNISGFNSSVERAGKLSKTTTSKTIMAFYNHHQLFVFSKGSIVFIVVATAEANSGSILNLKTYLEPLVAELQTSNSLSDVSSVNFSTSVPSSGASGFAGANQTGGRR